MHDLCKTKVPENGCKDIEKIKDQRPKTKERGGEGERGRGGESLRKNPCNSVTSVVKE